MRNWILKRVKGCEILLRDLEKDKVVCINSYVLNIKWQYEFTFYGEVMPMFSNIGFIKRSPGLHQ